MRKISIDDEAFHNLLKMLTSTEEDAVVALTTINNVNFDSSMTKILLLKKLGNVNKDMWNTYAKKAYNWINRNGLDPDKNLTWQEIFDHLLRKKVPVEDIQFFLNCFGLKLFKSIKGVGYDFLDNVEINLKYNDTREKRKSSESIERVDA